MILKSNPPIQIEITDLNGFMLSVPDLDDAIGQAECFRQFHSETTASEFDNRQKRYWTDLHNKLSEKETEFKIIKNITHNMAHQELKDFAEWLFNRYVESEQRSHFGGSAFETTLKQFTEVVLKARKHAPNRSRAKSLLKEIQLYQKQRSSYKLEYVGEESAIKKQEAEEQRKELYRKYDIPYTPNY